MDTLTIKQAITDTHLIDGLEANPKAIFTVVAHNHCEKYGIDALHACIYSLAMQVALETGCYFASEIKDNK